MRVPVIFDTPRVKPSCPRRWFFRFSCGIRLSLEGFTAHEGIECLKKRQLHCGGRISCLARNFQAQIDVRLVNVVPETIASCDVPQSSYIVS